MDHKLKSHLHTASEQQCLQLQWRFLGTVTVFLFLFLRAKNLL